MKTFAFDSIERFQRFSDLRNIKKTICNKPWQAFSDDANAETYTFMVNGNVMITLKGNTLKGSWDINTKAAEITLSGSNNSHKFRIVYFDKVLLALQPIGGKDFSFLINKSNDIFFEPKIYTDIIKYLRQKEADEDKQAIAVANSNNEPTESQPEEFKQKVKQIKQQNDLRLKAQQLYSDLNARNSHYGVMVVIAICTIIYLLLFAFNYWSTGLSLAESIINSLFYGTIINVLVSLLCINKLVAKILELFKIWRWKHSHPDDSRNKFL
ncbi:MAG: hypothetical protein ACI4AH_08750 [Muribaculaceae bacterium]